METQQIETAKDELSSELLYKIDGYWRAANYLSVGQIYLCDNPLLRRPLALTDIKHMLLGHWGTTPGQNFIYVHLNRIIKKYDLDMIYVSGPGHGGPAIVANTYLEGSYSEIYPNVLQDMEGMKRLFRQFSWPGGIPSHTAAETPGSIHEGGELGYGEARMADDRSANSEGLDWTENCRWITRRGFLSIASGSNLQLTRTAGPSSAS